MGNSRLSRRIHVSDNLACLATFQPRSVTLAYVDPPFNSGRSYEAVLFRERLQNGIGSDLEAFNDRWAWNEEVEREFSRLAEFMSARNADVVRALVNLLGRTEFAAYLAVMAPRLSQIHRVLDERGSLYVHCDPGAGHYLRVVLDQIFGRENFRNEVVWRRTHAHSGSRRYGPIHDSIIFYTKNSKYVWNQIHTEYSPLYLANHFTHEDSKGKYQLITCTAPGDRAGTRAHYQWEGKFPPPGRHWAWQREQMEKFEEEGRLVYSSNGIPRLKRYVNDGKGVPLQDTWLDIQRLDAHSDERIGFETQKPVKLLERIILTSSSPGDLILDAFCGSGTALVAAERLGRAWVGIDSSLLACALALARARREVGTGRVELRGFPSSSSAALTLKRAEPLIFGVWAAGMLATLPDRGLSSHNMISGSGQLTAGRRVIRLSSWIPLSDQEVQMEPLALQRRAAHDFGLLLCTDRSHSRLRKNIERELGITVAEVSVDHLIQQESLNRGIAPVVSELARNR